MRDNAHLVTRNQTYTMIQGVLVAFRKRLDYREALGFANVLPPVTRAIFVADWNLDEPKQAFADCATMTIDASSLRKEHIFLPKAAFAMSHKRFVSMSIWRYSTIISKNCRKKPKNFGRYDREWRWRSVSRGLVSGSPVICYQATRHGTVT
nr:DUF2267 domain-containing protein [Agrobacterium vitis]